ncbi:MAG: hypothetical protein GX159_09945 [Flavobacteriaceae bacterium]|jgi:hypothetical protein|nr:hypothetical protein [Flavobacteriaceae bacterium]
MKNLFKISFILVFSIGIAQEDKTFKPVADNPTERVSESGTVTFEKTLYGINFDRSVSGEIKDKITKFLKTNPRGFTSPGTYTVRLVKRNGKLYLKEKEFPEKLIEL